MAEKKVFYAEPEDYIPKEIRQKYGLGEYSEIAKKRAEEEKEAQKEDKE